MVQVNTQAGGFFGGAAGGLSTGAQVGAKIAGQRVDQQQLAAQQEETQRANNIKQLQKNRENLIARLGDISAGSKGGGNFEDKQAQFLINQFVKTEQLLAEENGQGGQFDVNASIAAAEAARFAPTAEEQRAKAVADKTAAASAQVQGAATGGIAAAEQAFGGPLTQAQTETAIGQVPPAPPTPERQSLFTLVGEKGGRSFAGTPGAAVKALGPGEQAFPASATTLSGAESGLTKPAETKLETKGFEAEALVANIPAGIQLILDNPEAVGVLGVFNEFVINKIIAQINTESFKAGVANTRQFMRSIRESSLRSVSDDKRFNKEDRAAISAMFPETGPVESTPNAVAKLKTLGIFMLNRQSLTEQQRNTSGAKEVLTVPQITKALSAKSAREIAMATQGSNPQYTDAQARQVIQIMFPAAFAQGIAAEQTAGGQ